MFDRDNSGTINHNEIKWEKIRVQTKIKTTLTQKNTMRSGNGTKRKMREKKKKTGTINHNEIKWGKNKRKDKNKTNSGTRNHNEIE